MFDLDAYLLRIGYHGVRGRSLGVLQAVCEAHPAAMAFENIDPLLGRVPSLEPQALQQKMVGQRRGGYCFEHSLLLLQALRALGFAATLLTGRVVLQADGASNDRPRTHALLRVELADAAAAGSYVVDPGFGGQVIAVPLLLEPDLPQAGPGGVVRLTTDGRIWTLENRLAEQWSALYRFTLEPYVEIDLEPLNWFIATHPASMFRHNLLVERLTPTRRASLFNDRLRLRPEHGPPTVTRLGSADELWQTLEQVFNVVPPVPAEQLWERIPKGLDGALVPAAMSAAP